MHSRTITSKRFNHMKFRIQEYIENNTFKLVRIDLTDFLDPYSQFTNYLIDTIRETISISQNSLRIVKDVLNTTLGIDISYQTIENIIFNIKEPKQEGKINGSGYYVFDTEYVKINGIWHYRLTLIDTQTHKVLKDEIYAKEDHKSLKKFFNEFKKQHQIISITTDLNKKYPKIIQQGFIKHQYCVFHFIKGEQKRIKRKLKNKNLTSKEKQKILRQWKQIQRIFQKRTRKLALKKFETIKRRKKQLHPILHTTLQRLSDNLTYLLYFLEDPRIEKTSNMVENFFQKTMPKHKKRIMKTSEGVHKRTILYNKKWEQHF